jgi:hypothetical protein
LEVRLFPLLLPWVLRAAEFQQFSGQWWQSVQQAHTKALIPTDKTSHIGHGAV